MKHVVMQLWVIVGLHILQVCFMAPAAAQDVQADNMVAYQRHWGGWPKHINEVKIDYTLPLTNNQHLAVMADSMHKDATLDNSATTKEIRYLAGAYKKYNNPAYLKAVNKGIKYLLAAQYPIGGWPQYYPDSSLYRGQITYNDNAFINVMNLLLDAKLGIKDLEVVDRNYEPAINNAIDKGIQCILRNQIKIDGILTGWCAQYDQKTLAPANARKFELVSVSGMESVGVVLFLMRVEQPTQAIRQAITAAVNWLNMVKIKGYDAQMIDDPKQPKGKDRVLVPVEGAEIWARFYDIKNNKPFFTGRDGIKKWNLTEVEVERRTGYAWYGNWPKKLIEIEYPKWLKKHRIGS